MPNECIYICVSVLVLVAVFNVDLEEEERVGETRRLLTEDLPSDNYTVLKRIISFLVQVCLLISSLHFLKVLHSR